MMLSNSSVASSVSLSGVCCCCCLFSYVPRCQRGVGCLRCLTGFRMMPHMFCHSHSVHMCVCNVGVALPLETMSNHV